MRAQHLLNHPSLWIRAVILLGVAAWALACGEHSTQPTIDGISIRAAKGGNGGGKGGNGDVTVKDTDPPGAPQGTRLVVKVTGSGFDETSELEMLLNEQTTDDITTNSTGFVSSREVQADITIAADAAVDLFDVEVTAAGGGRRGIGIELFEVKSNPHPLNSSASAVGAIGWLEQPVRTDEDGNNLNVWRNVDFHGGLQDVLFNFKETYGEYVDEVTAGLGPCKYSGKAAPADATRRMALFEKLAIDQARDREYFNANIYKPALEAASESEEHRWSHTWKEEEGTKQFSAGINLKQSPDEFPGVVPTVTRMIGTDDYEFRGGVVGIGDRSGKVKDQLWIRCPNLDVAVLKLTPPAP